jgi:hypothetical protein
VTRPGQATAAAAASSRSGTCTRPASNVLEGRAEQDDRLPSAAEPHAKRHLTGLGTVQLKTIEHEPRLTIRPGKLNAEVKQRGLVIMQ